MKEWRNGEYVEVEPKTSKVKYVLEIIWYMKPIWIFGGLMLFFLVGVPNIWHDDIEKMREQNQLRTDLKVELNELIRETKDCSVLQDEMLKLISNNANADSWLPNISDRTLKIAQERYEILC